MAVTIDVVVGPLSGAAVVVVTSPAVGGVVGSPPPGSSPPGSSPAPGFGDPGRIEALVDRFHLVGDLLLGGVAGGRFDRRFEQRLPEDEQQEQEEERGEDGLPEPPRQEGLLDQRAVGGGRFVAVLGRHDLERQPLRLTAPESLLRNHLDRRERGRARLDGQHRWHDEEPQLVLGVDRHERRADLRVAVVVDGQLVTALAASRRHRREELEASVVERGDVEHAFFDH